jgi:hypothetical protein
MKEDYEIFIPLYEDALIFKRWKSVAENEGYTYFETHSKRQKLHSS